MINRIIERTFYGIVVGGLTMLIIDWAGGPNWAIVGFGFAACCVAVWENK